jgi:hypothetical protein
MTAWSLPKKATIAGVVSGKLNHIATIHTGKGLPKSARLDGRRNHSQARRNKLRFIIAV